MKQNAENSQGEMANQDQDLQIVEMPCPGGSGRTLMHSTARRATQSRPEVAVLGWNARSYRLALRESKA